MSKNTADTGDGRAPHDAEDITLDHGVESDIDRMTSDERTSSIASELIGLTNALMIQHDQDPGVAAPGPGMDGMGGSGEPEPSQASDTPPDHDEDAPSSEGPDDLDDGASLDDRAAPGERAGEAVDPDQQVDKADHAPVQADAPPIDDAQNPGDADTGGGSDPGNAEASALDEGPPAPDGTQDASLNSNPLDITEEDDELIVAGAGDPGGDEAEDTGGDELSDGVKAAEDILDEPLHDETGRDRPGNLRQEAGQDSADVTDGSGGEPDKDDDEDAYDHFMEAELAAINDDDEDDEDDDHMLPVSDIIEGMNQTSGTFDEASIDEASIDEVAEDEDGEQELREARETFLDAWDAQYSVHKPAGIAAPPKATAEFAIPRGVAPRVPTEDIDPDGLLDFDPLTGSTREGRAREEVDKTLSDSPDVSRLQGQPSWSSGSDDAPDTESISQDDVTEEVDEEASGDRIEPDTDDVSLDVPPDDVSSETLDNEIAVLYGADTLEDDHRSAPGDDPGDTDQAGGQDDARDPARADAEPQSADGQAADVPDQGDNAASETEPASDRKARKGLMSSSSIVPAAAAVLIIGALGFTFFPNEVRQILSIGGDDPVTASAPGDQTGPAQDPGTDTGSQDQAEVPPGADMAEADPGDAPSGGVSGDPERDDARDPIGEDDLTGGSDSEATPEPVDPGAAQDEAFAAQDDVGLDDVVVPEPEFSDDMRMSDERRTNEDDLALDRLEPVEDEVQEDVVERIDGASAEEVAALEDTIAEMEAVIESMSDQMDDMASLMESMQEGDEDLREEVDSLHVRLSTQDMALSEVYRLEDRLEEFDLQMVDISERFRAIEGINVAREARIAAETAVSVNVDSMESRIENRLDQLNNNLGIIARMAADGGSVPTPPTGGSGQPPQATNPGDVYASSNPSTGNNPSSNNPAPSSDQASGDSGSFVVSSSNEGNLRDVDIGDHVEGYGMVLNIQEATGGGQIVVMENGAVFVD